MFTMGECVNACLIIYLQVGFYVRTKDKPIFLPVGQLSTFLIWSAIPVLQIN
jgi:hypothetical protein